MNLINYKKIDASTLESLAALWIDKDFQVFVNILRNRRLHLATACLKTRDIENITEIQIEAELINNIINAIKEASNKQEQREKQK